MYIVEVCTTSLYTTLDHMRSHDIILWKGSPLRWCFFKQHWGGMYHQWEITSNRSKPSKQPKTLHHNDIMDESPVLASVMQTCGIGKKSSRDAHLNRQWILYKTCCLLWYRSCRLTLVMIIYLHWISCGHWNVAATSSIVPWYCQHASMLVGGA